MNHRSPNSRPARPANHSRNSAGTVVPLRPAIAPDDAEPTGGAESGVHTDGTVDVPITPRTPDPRLRPRYDGGGDAA